MDLNNYFSKKDIEVANKHVKSYSISIITEMQIKTTMRYHHIYIRMAITKKKKRTSFGEDVKKLNLCELLQWKPVWQLFNKLKIELSYDPASPLLGIYLKELKAGSQTDICPHIHSNII